MKILENLNIKYQLLLLFIFPLMVYYFSLKLTYKNFEKYALKLKTSQN